MYTPRLTHRRWFGDSTVPAARPEDSSLRKGSYTPVLQLHDDIDRLFDGMFRGMLNPWETFDFMPRWVRRGDGSATSLLPRLDVNSDEKSYTVSVELPGVKPDAVTCEVRDRALIIRGEKKDETCEEKKDCHVSERSYGSFERVLTLPEDAMVDDIRATHKNGVLTISIPRREPEKPQARSIEISQE